MFYLLIDKWLSECDSDVTSSAFVGEACMGAEISVRRWSEENSHIALEEYHTAAVLQAEPSRGLCKAERL